MSLRDLFGSRTPPPTVTAPPPPVAPLPRLLVEAHIRNLTPHASGWVVAGIIDNQDDIVKGGIDTPLRLCHFMAQLAHESAGFTVTREFASGAAYEGRRDLGNTHPGDGVRYRGRGLIQSTGRANYREATDDIRKMIPTAPDFEASPLELEKFPWALLAGISYWRRRNLNAAADRDDINTITKKINGGYNGLAERVRYLAKAKTIWLTGAPMTEPLLAFGDTGAAVTKLQELLIKAGFALTVDGKFGDETKLAVIAFQTRQGLGQDGVVGAATWKALSGI